MNTVQIPKQLTVAWLTKEYQDKRMKPVDVIRGIIQRAHEDQGLNIWITPPSMELIQPYLDALESTEPSSLPLWGIPFAVKDNIDVAGMRTTAACPEYAYLPAENASVVERLIAAGAIPVGKANLDQFATGLVGTRSPYGETGNALKPELISGGSSSGSAVAVARGQAAFSLGTDTAGSGRVPAALNGLVGFKSSLGAWSTSGVVPACASLDCVTVFAHNINDALLVDACVRGEDTTDPWSRKVERGIDRPPARLLIPEQALDFYGPYAESYRSAWAAVVERLQSLSIPVETIDTRMFSEAAAILYDGPLVAERWAEFEEFIESHPGKAFPVTEQILRSGAQPQFDAASVFRATHKLQDFKQQAKQLLKDAVLVLPTCGGTWTREMVRQDPIRTNSDMGKYTNHCNLLDLCAVAVPSGEAEQDVPFGTTFFATADAEGLIVNTAKKWLTERPSTLVAVCGLHMRGFPLEQQMREHEASFVGETATADKYRMLKLNTTPPKPGLIKTGTGGGAIQVEVWSMPLDRFGAFVAHIPAPLGIGKIELADGSEVPGFICEGSATDGAEDITSTGGWRAWSGL